MSAARRLSFILAVLAAAPAWGEDPAVVPAPDDSVLPPGAVARIGTTRMRECNYITAVAFTRDGKRLAWGGERGSVVVCDAASGKSLLEVKAFPERNSPVTEVAFSPDGRLLAVSGYWMKDVHLFDLEARKLLHNIPNTAEGQERRSRLWQGAGFAFTPDGKALVIGGKNGSFLLADVETGRERLALSETKEVVVNVSLSADGNTALTAHYGGELFLWDIGGEKQLRKLEAKAKYPHFTALAPDGKTVALATDDKTIELHDVAKGLRHKLTTKALVYGIGFNADGTILNIAESDGRVSSWDTGSGAEKTRLTTCDQLPAFSDPRRGSKDWAWFPPDGKTVAWGQISTLRVFDLSNGEETPKLPGLRQGVSAASFSADGKTLILGAQQGELQVWDWAGERQVGEARRMGAGESIRLAIAPDRRKAAITVFGPVSDPRAFDRGGRALIWDVAANRAPAEFRTEKPVLYAALTPDGRHLVASEADEQIRVYEAASGELRRAFPVPKFGYPLTFSPDGSRLAVRTPDLKLRIYRFSSGEMSAELKLPAGLNAVAFSPDGRLIATGHVAGEPRFGEPPGNIICIWDAATGAKLREFRPSRFYVNGVAFSPDGRLLASCGFDGAVELWELSSVQMRRKYEGHSNWINAIDFAPDGRHLLSASSDGTAIVWRVFDAPAAMSLDAAWNDLAGPGEKAHAAIAALAADKGAADFLAARVKPAAKPAEDEVKRWLAELASDRFAVREAAEKNLARAGVLAEAALRSAQQSANDVELRRRLVALIDNLPRVETRPERLRELRAVEVLERTGSAEARHVLEGLAIGEPAALLTQHAKASLNRLAK
jgi:WD40 repeat protein